MSEPIRLDEIARRISGHLRRFEKDPKINARDSKYGTTAYYHAGAFRSGSRVGVRYVSYQLLRYLTKAEALRYLAWLDAGNVGKHFEETR